MRRSRSTVTACSACANSSRRPRAAPPAWVPTASKCMRRTAICCMSFSPRWPISARMSTAAACRIACAFRSRYFEAVRSAFPAERPVWIRVSATDWVANGWDIEGTLAFARALGQRGCAAIHVSSGGLSSAQSIKPAPGYQLPFAKRIKAELGIATIAVGLISEAEQAESIIASGTADAVSLARAMLYDPRWPWHAAAKLGAHVSAPKQYWRCQPAEHPDLFQGARFGQR
jgi:hypothetical protein